MAFNFKKAKCKVVRGAISKDLAMFIYNYILLKRQVYNTLSEAKYISPFEQMHGHYEKANEQIPFTYACYGDIAMDTLMLKLQPIMEKVTGMKLQPSYTYTRVYKDGDVLLRHKDRFSCEISCTVHLGHSHQWPIFIDPDPTHGKETPTGYIMGEGKGLKVNFEPGDMIAYHGLELEHWREKFKGTDYGQVFVHYNQTKTEGAKENLFDRRLHVGLPSRFKRR